MISLFTAQFEDRGEGILTASLSIVRHFIPIAAA
jgi:hypothetical protein